MIFKLYGQYIKYSVRLNSFVPNKVEKIFWYNFNLRQDNDKNKNFKLICH